MHKWLKIACFVLVGISLSACSDGKDATTDTSTDIASETSFSTGLTHMYFTDWSGPRVPVWVYVPDDVDMETAPIMFMMHGALRGAARYLSEWDQIADREGFIVVAPEFTRDDFPKGRGYNLGNMHKKENGEEVKVDEELWSFSAIEPIFDHVVKLLGSNQTEYTLYGHSAGSQFTHRFLFFKPEARVKRYLPANAGWYTFPDLDIDYPFGLGDIDLTEEDLIAILEKDVVILLGDKDNDPNHKSLSRRDGSILQGEHRFARGLNFYETAKTNAEKLGADFGWQLRVVEGVAHSNGNIAKASGDLIE